MNWVDIDGYVGPDRRKRARPRLLDRRRFNAAREAPSIAVLLRQLHLRALDAALGDAATLAKYRTRVQAIAALARERGEASAAGWLDVLWAKLQPRALGDRARASAGDVICRYVQSAMASLR
jgi:hypothetical protein